VKNHAWKAKDWPEWRDKAIRYMREQVAETTKETPGSRRRSRPLDHSGLVRVFVYEEKDVEVAWREASVGGCSEDLWMKLAELREEEHPEESLEVYIAQVDPIIDRKDKQSYQEAVDLMQKIKALMEQTGRGDEFPTYVAALRARHGRKKNLMKLLDAEEMGLN